MKTQNSSTPAKPAGARGQPPSATTSGDEKSASSEQLAAGIYAVVPLIQISTPTAAAGKRTNQTAKVSKKAAADAAAAKMAAEKAAANKTASAKDKAARKNQAEKLAAVAKKAAAEADQAADAAQPKYMPFKVTDEKGKPLTFTIPDTKKPSSAAQATTSPASATCIAPSFVNPCTVSCPQAASPASPPKNP